MIGNKNRKSYHKAADLLVAMVEAFVKRGEKQKGGDLIAKYRSKYPRYSAFKSEIMRSMQESGSFT